MLLITPFNLTSYTCVAESGDIPPSLGDIPETFSNRQLSTDTSMLLQQRLVCEKPGATLLLACEF